MIEHLEREVASLRARETHREDRSSALFRTVGTLARDAVNAMGIPVPAGAKRAASRSQVTAGNGDAAASGTDATSLINAVGSDHLVVADSAELGAEYAISALQAIAAAAADTDRERASHTDALWARCVAAERHADELQRERDMFRSDAERRQRIAKEASQVAKQRDRDLKNLSKKLEASVAESTAESAELKKRCDTAEVRVLHRPLTPVRAMNATEHPVDPLRF
jgi:hypothetical protein